MSRKDGYFKLKRKVKFKEIGDDHTLPESDLCFQDDKHIFQYEYIENKEESTVDVEPGVFKLVNQMHKAVPQKMELRTNDIKKDITNSKRIYEEANVFFDNLDVYEELGETKARKILLFSDPGMGKCLGVDTPVLMYDGSIKMVQDVETGDKLMGPDSEPRNVLSTTVGQETMYRITPVKGDSYIVNESHILSLRMSGDDEIHNISVKDYLALPSWKQKRLKGWRSGIIDFEDHSNELQIDPYILGLWLGDGSSSKPEICSADEKIITTVECYFNGLDLNVSRVIQNNGLVALRATSGERYGKRNRNIFTNFLKQLSLWGNKHVPLIYKTASRSSRLELLAGLVDSDGSYYNGIFDFNLKSESLANDIAYLARSLGYAAYINKNQKVCGNSKTKAIGTYFRVQISGDIEEVPVQLNRKKANERKQVKNVLRTGITVEKLEIDNYYGFTLDGDHLFMLGDFTVTHNTATITDFCHNAVAEDPGTVVIIWPTSTVESHDVLEFLSKNSEYTKECTRLILVMEDIGGGEREGSGGSRSVDSSLLDILDGIGVTFKLPTLMIATTNYPQNLLSALADRPGRFDLMMKLNPPTPEERVQIVEFISKRELNEDEKRCILSKDINDFSIAHLKEVIIRARLHKKSICETVKELIQHKKNFKQSYEDKKGVGFGSGDMWD